MTQHVIRKISRERAEKTVPTRDYRDSFTHFIQCRAGRKYVVDSRPLIRRVSGHRRPPWKTVEALELAILEGVTGFKPRRLLESIGYIPPAEAEDRYGRQRTVQAEHACAQIAEPP